jgi:hypothetical protein
MSRCEYKKYVPFVALAAIFAAAAYGAFYGSSFTYFLSAIVAAGVLFWVLIVFYTA